MEVGSSLGEIMWVRFETTSATTMEFGMRISTFERVRSTMVRKPTCYTTPSCSFTWMVSPSRNGRSNSR